ncbi:MAG: hypothetical protein KDC46_08995, partial [Thermoleophilia bacterium]|nr:hypothetical protein [Thermoleophilia bacterium]
LVAGVAAIAAGIALLAPGDDTSSGQQGLLGSLGPDPAAAEVLHAAGKVAGDSPWRPLHGTEQLLVTTRDHYSTNTADWVSETRVKADGTFAIRAMIDPSTVADGGTFYMLAARCQTVDPTAPPKPDLDPEDMVQVGSTPPACWSESGSPSPLLANATGRVVDAPPAGVVVYLDQYPGGSDGRTLRFGTDVVETDDPAAGGPGGMQAAMVRPDGTVQPATFQPHSFRRAMTWVEVEPKLATSFEVDGATGQASTISPLFVSWTSAFDVRQLAKLPTTASGMRAELQRAADEHLSPATGNIADMPMPDADDTEARQVIREDVMVMLASDLLAAAPISPEVRRATFDALAELRNNGQAGKVLPDAKLPDGRPAIGVEFPIRYPAADTSDPTGGTGRTVLLLDAETAELKVRRTELGDFENVTTWTSERRGGD